MDVLLKVTYEQEYEVIIRGVESIEQAKKSFDPCEDLEGLVATYGNAYPTDGVEIKDCPDCGARGYHFTPMTPEHIASSTRCNTCKGDGYLKIENKEDNDDSTDPS